MTLRQINIDKINTYNRDKFTEDMKSLASRYCGVHCTQITNSLNCFDMIFEEEFCVEPVAIKYQEHTKLFIQTLEGLKHENKDLNSILTFLIDILTFNLDYVKGVKMIAS